MKKQQPDGDVVPEDQKNIVTDLATNLKPLVQKLAANIAKLQKSSEDLNLKVYVESYSHFERDLRTLVEIWDIHEKSGNDLVSQANTWFTGTEYPQVLETYLHNFKLPFTGSFPDYEIPPFKLSIQVERRVVKLSMGKKSQSTSVFAPEPLASWVSDQYHVLINSPFNSDQLCKELLAAYQYLSKNNSSVSLKDVYQILTLRSNTRQEYPESIFMFDIGRLLESFKIEYKGYSFIFAPHLEHNKNYTLIDRNGTERQVGLMRISNILTIN